MEERDFDIIVVGSGIAGAAAAYVAAKRGKSVLVVERGESCGSKNMTGGRMYAHALRDMLDAYADGEVDWGSIPFERKIAHERISLLDVSCATTIDFSSENLLKEGNDSYSILRATFDPWMAQLAEDAGAEYINGIPVEELIRDESGAVTGVRAGEDVITSHVVIDAEGCNSMLAERCLGITRPRPEQMAVSVKEVFELPPSTISDRFLCAENEGAAMLFVGDCTHGVVGGGFLYTNKDSISLGLVSTISSLEDSDTTIYQALDDFKRHPAVAPVIRGSRLVEHSGHMIPEGGFDMVPKRTFDGCLLVGDAAMLCMNLGYQVRGLDFALASGRYAAEAACDAIDAQDVSATGLGAYEAKIEGSFVLKDLETFREWPKTMASWDGMFKKYPKLAGDVLDCLFVVDGTPQVHLKKRAMPILKEYGLFKLLKEVRGALKAL